ncbi:MAG: hypothetical protein WC011_02855 [Candidatus Paceibacterota bacterium]
MINKHFMKTLVLFTGMIVLGLGVIFLVSYLDEQQTASTELSDNNPSFAN